VQNNLMMDSSAIAELHKQVWGEVCLPPQAEGKACDGWEAALQTWITPVKPITPAIAIRARGELPLSEAVEQCSSPQPARNYACSYLEVPFALAGIMDIQAALRFAHLHKLDVSVKGGGHSVVGAEQHGGRQILSYLENDSHCFTSWQSTWKAKPESAAQSLWVQL
jgi:hypothetical protein